MREDPFEVLGLHRTASRDEIKDAYRILCKKWHPDMHADLTAKEQAEVQFKRVQQAYSLVSGRDRSTAAVNYYAQNAWNARAQPTWTNKQFSLYLLGLSVAGGAFGIWWSRMVGERDLARRATFEMHQAEQDLHRRGLMPIVQVRQRPTSDAKRDQNEEEGEALRPGPSPKPAAKRAEVGVDEQVMNHPVNIHRRHTQQLRQWRMTYTEEEVEQLRELRWQRTRLVALQEAGKGAVVAGSSMGVAALCVRTAVYCDIAPFTRIPSLLTRTPSICFYVSGAAAAGFFIRGHQTASPRGRNHTLIDNIDVELPAPAAQRDAERR